MHIVCAHCGAVNRVPKDKSFNQAKCGKCGNHVYEQKPVELHDSSFYPYIEKNHLPVIVDFWASWCGPCKAMAPVYDKVASESESLLFAKVNTENAPAVSADAGIRSIPTLIFFYQGKEIDRLSGGLGEMQLKQWIMQAISKLST